MLVSTIFTFCLLNTFVAGKGHDHGFKLEVKRGQTPTPQCFSDNCYRHLLHTPTLAAALCTYTKTVSTTVFPTITVAPLAPAQNIQGGKKRAAMEIPAVALPTSCAVSAGTALTSRVSSACSCLRSEIATFTSTITAPAATATAATCQNGEHIFMETGVDFYVKCDVQPISTSYAAVEQFVANTFRDCLTECYHLGPESCQAATFVASKGLTSGVCTLAPTSGLEIEDAPGARWAIYETQQKKL